MAYLKANPEIGVAGYPDGTFRPYQKINSQEFAKVLLESLKYEDPADYTWGTVPTKAAEIGLVADASDVNMGTIIKELSFAVLTYDALTLIAKGSDVTLGEELGTPIVITKLDVKSVESVNSSIQDVKLNKAAVVAPSTSVFTLVDSDDKEIAIESAHVRDNGTTVRLKTDSLEANALYTLTYDGTAYKFVAKAADTTKPELTSAVATANKTVQLNFSEEVDVTALTASNYTIEGLNVVSAAYEVDADNNPIKTTIILTTTSQAQGTIYKVEVKNVTDLSENVINTDHDEYQFGGLPQDEDKPELQSTVSLTNTSVELIFSEVMDEAKVENVANYAIEGLDVLKAERQTDKSHVILTTSAQQTTTIYKVVVTNVTDLEGNVINSDHDESLFAGLAPDSTKPQLSAAAALTNTTVKVIFNEKVDEVTAENAANYTIEGLTITSAERQDNEAEVVLTTSAQTAPHVYTVKVENVTDLVGNVIDSDNDDRAFAGKAVDTTKPEVKDAESLSNTTVKVIFNEPINKEFAELPYNYYLGTELGYPTKVVKDTTITDGTVWVLTTAKQASKVYTVDVTGVTDLSGNILNEDKDTAEFAGIGTDDTSAPAVNSAVALNNNTVVVTFSEELDAATVVEGNFTFAYSSGNEQAGHELPANATKVILSEDKRTATLLFNGVTMKSGVIYKVTVANVTDATGNAISATMNNDALFASTSVANPAPKITSAMLLNNQSLKIMFSEPVMVDGSIATADDLKISHDKVGVDPFAGTIQNTVLASDKMSLTIYYTGDTFESAVLYTAELDATKIKDAFGLVTLDTENDNNKVLFGGINTEVKGAKISSIVSIDNNTFDIIFDQIVDVTSLVNTDIKVKKDSTEITPVLVRAEGEDGNKVRVFFSGTPFNSSIVYDVELNEDHVINKKNGLVMEDNTSQFVSVTTENAAPKLVNAVATTTTTVKVTFSEFVQSVDTTDFSIAGYTVDSVAKVDDKTYTITLNKATTTGELLVLSIDASSDITDEANVGSVDTERTVKFVAK